MLKKVAVFVSGGGSNMEALIEKQEHYQVCLVISDKKEAKALEKAEKRGIPNFFIGKENYSDKEERCRVTLEKLEEFGIDFLGLAGYLAIVPDEIVTAYQGRIVNIHPSLIPSFCGMGFHGSHVHQGVYDSGVKVTGATVHFVSEVVDGGAIIAQESVEVLSEDSPEDIGKKVLKIEHTIFPKVMNLLAQNRIKTENKRTFIVKE